MYKIKEHPDKYSSCFTFSHVGCSGFSHLGCSGALRSGQSLVCSWTISLRPLSGKCNKNFLARGFQSMSPASGSKSPGRRWRGVPPCSLLLCPAFASRDPQQSFQANTGVPSFCSFPPVLWSSQWQTPACRKTDCVKGNYCFVVSKSNFTLQKSSSESFKTKIVGQRLHLFLNDHVPKVGDGFRFWSLGRQKCLITSQKTYSAGIHIADLANTIILQHKSRIQTFGLLKTSDFSWT